MESQPLRELTLEDMEQENSEPVERSPLADLETEMIRGRGY